MGVTGADRSSLFFFNAFLSLCDASSSLDAARAFDSAGLTHDDFELSKRSVGFKRKS